MNKLFVYCIYIHVNYFEIILNTGSKNDLFSKCPRISGCYVNRCVNRTMLSDEFVYRNNDIYLNNCSERSYIMSNRALSNPALKDHKTVELNEEWNNFMKRIGEVSNLVKDMASGDKERAEAAKIVADKFLEGKMILEDDIKMVVKEDRTVINENAFKTMGKKDTVSEKIHQDSLPINSNNTIAIPYYYVTIFFIVVCMIMACIDFK